MSYVPTAEEAIFDLRPLTDILYPVLEAATAEARDFFEARGEPVEPYHYASTVRYVAKRLLLAQGHQAEYDLDHVPNNGLKMYFGLIDVRVRKVDRRQVDNRIVLAPSPGDSTVLQQFYSQQGSLICVGGAPVMPSRLNLLVLWETVNGYLELFASCPKSGLNSRKSVEEYWWAAIPHPASAIATVATAPSDAEVEYAPADSSSESENSHG